MEHLHLDAAAVEAVANKTQGMVGRIRFRYGHGNCLYLDLPSGRYLIYRDVKIVAGKKGPAVGFIDSNGEAQQLYGGKITENLCQALARDLLCADLIRCRDTAVLHVHDEIVQEGKRISFGKPAWAEGLPLDSAGFESQWYRKE